MCRSWPRLGGGYWFTWATGLILHWFTGSVFKDEQNIKTKLSMGTKALTGQLFFESYFRQGVHLIRFSPYWVHPTFLRSRCLFNSKGEQKLFCRLGFTKKYYRLFEAFFTFSFFPQDPSMQGLSQEALTHGFPRVPTPLVQNTNKQAQL